jgi:structural maintenance of chromosome 2
LPKSFTNPSQIIQAVEEMKASITQLKNDIVDAKTRHAEATKDIKRIEKDIKDFSSNKDSKLAELESSLEALKKSQAKNSVAVKTLQKELQEARLESEQSGGDLAAAQEQMAEVESSLKAQEEEINALVKEQGAIKVRLSEDSFCLED